MRPDYFMAIVLAIAALPFGVAVMAAPLYWEIPKHHLALFFWGGLSLSAFLILLAVLVAFKGEMPFAPTGYMRSVALAVMVLSTITGIGGAAVYFFPVQLENPPVSAAANPSSGTGTAQHLMRTLSYDNLGIQVVNANGRATLGTFSGRIQNVGQDSLMVDIKNLKVLIGDKEVFNGPLPIEHYMASGRGVDFGAMTLRRSDVGEIEIPPGTSDITEEFSIEYDTASPSGLRRSYRKVVYPLTWTEGKCTAERGRIIDARED
jgi:hypothetical protein